jgi:hypothetical protein
VQNEVFRPVVAPYRPAAHDTQDPAPDKEVYVPTEQLVHAVLLTGAYFPATQTPEQAEMVIPVVSPN